MANPIHARKRFNGKQTEWRYRIWSTITDSYITNVLTEAQLREDIADGYTETEKVNGSMDQDITVRIHRAQARGTSAFNGVPADLDGPWEAELSPDTCIDAPTAPHDQQDATNEELIYENNRLPAMLHCLSKAGMGKSGCVEIMTAPGEGGANGLRLVITRADADENAFMALVGDMINKAVKAILPGLDGAGMEVDTTKVISTGTSATSEHDGTPKSASPKARPVKDFEAECRASQMVIVENDRDPDDWHADYAINLGPGQYRGAEDAIGEVQATSILETIATNAGLSPSKAIDPVPLRLINRLHVAINECVKHMSRFVDAGYDVRVTGNKT